MNTLESILRPVLSIIALSLVNIATLSAQQALDTDRALEHSQAAIGRTVSDHRFLDTDGRAVRLSKFADRPVLVSLIYTSCHHTCPMITQNLKDQVSHAQDRLGSNTFNTITIGFDARNDTPRAMKAFRRTQGVSNPRWHFLSADQETVNSLADELGFRFVRSPRGFDHLVQLTVLNRDRRIATQIYGARFQSPRLMEPLKRLVLEEGLPSSSGLVDGLINRVRLFCTVYDPNTGRYMFDYSLFIQMAIGALIIFGISAYLLRERRRRRQC